jgi:hypothetical protein
MASVDGEVLSYSRFDEYAAVFTDPDGKLRVAREAILLSLINQALVQTEATRRGIDVTNQDVDASITGIRDSGVPVDLNRASDVTGLRERVRMFLVFGRVRDAVIGQVTISDAELRAAYAADAAFQSIPFNNVAEALRERMETAEIDLRWGDWLAHQRSCAEIVVFDGSIGMPSSTPSAECINSAQP